MNETGRYLFAIGVAILGVGLTLLFQGLSLHKPRGRNKISNWAFTIGIGWGLFGLYFIVVGIAAMTP